MADRFRPGARVFCAMATDAQHRRAGIVEVLRDGPCGSGPWSTTRSYLVRALTDIRSWPASDRAGARILWHVAGEEFHAASSILEEVVR